jgi:hypothetical protein
VTSFSLHDVFRFDLEGGGPLPDYLRMQYAEFECDGTIDAPELLVRVERAELELPRAMRLSGDDAGYSRSGMQFVLETAAGRLHLDGSTQLESVDQMTVGPGFPRMVLNCLLELRFRLAMCHSDTVLVHACCLARGSTGLLLPAWKGTGKTSLALTLLDRGYGFLGDDRVWLRRDGELLCYPRYLVINASNAGDFADLLDARTRLAHDFNRALKESARIPEPVARIARRVVPPPVNYFKVAEIFPDAEVPKRATLRSAFFVVRPGSKDIGWNERSSLEMATAVGAVGDFEWNADLLSLTAAHDVLFPEGPSWRQEIDELMRTEREVLRDAFESACCAEIRLPSEVDWQAVADAVDARAKG